MTKDSKKSKDNEAPPVSESRADGGSKDGLPKKKANKALTKASKRNRFFVGVEFYLIMQSAKAGSKVALGLGSIMYGGLGLYLASAVMVVYYPQIMTWLGLEPFIEYLIQAQIEGYNNLAELNSFQFADYFFYFHAASLLMMGIINAVFIVFLAATLSKLSEIFPDMLSKDYLRVFFPREILKHRFTTTFVGKIFKIFIESPRILYFVFALVVVGIGFWLITAPAGIGFEGGLFTVPAHSIGIGMIIVFWISFYALFQWFILAIASRVSHYYWPSRKWFVDDESHKHD